MKKKNNKIKLIRKIRDTEDIKYYIKNCIFIYCGVFNGRFHRDYITFALIDTIAEKNHEFIINNVESFNKRQRGYIRKEYAYLFESQELGIL